jgi:uncharacterized protein YndB with AHSA1/START domain
MGHAELEREITIDAPLAQVFAGLADHEAMARWPGVSRARLITEGTPRNGVGAVRAITAGGLTLHEQVVAFDPPRGYDYTIVKGLPVRHLGQVRCTEVNGRTRVRWHVSIDSPVPLLARGIILALGLGLGRALTFFKQETEQRRGQAH